MGTSIHASRKAAKRGCPAGLLACLAAAILAGGCGGDDGEQTTEPKSDNQSAVDERQNVAFDAGPVPKELTGSWVNRIEPGEDTVGRTQLLPAGDPLCVQLTKTDRHGCYAGEPLRGPGAEMWRAENRGRFVEYGLAGTRDGKLVWHVMFEPLGVCADTESVFSYSVRGQRLTLKAVDAECKAHQKPSRLWRE